jgi:protein ImuB
VIPSYDDLTPGIPDVPDSGTVDQLALFLREDLNTRSGGQEKSRQPTPDLQTPCLFACLRLSADRRRPTANGERHAVNGELAAVVKAPPWQALLAVARDFSPRVRQASDCEVLLDVSGLGALIGAPPVIATELARALREAGVSAHVAIAPTQTMARLLATRSPDDSLTRLPDLPVGVLQPFETLPPGITHRNRARPYETLARWGLATLGDLAALPAAELSARLGRRGIALQRLARGLDPAPFVPDGETPRYIGRLELEWPIEALEPLSFVFARLLEPLSVALERADRGAAAVRLELRLTDRSTLVRVLQLPVPMRDPRVLRTLLLLDLESHLPSPLGFGATRPRFGEAGAGRREPPRRGRSSEAMDVMIDVVTLELDPAPARITQFSLLQRALPSPETLSTLTARLVALVGESRVGAAVIVDTHEPGAFQMERYAPEHGAGGADAAPGAGRAGAEGAPLVLRRQRHPPAIRVSVEHGRPVHLAASSRAMPQGAVVQAAGPWRSSGGWWAVKGDSCRAESGGRPVSPPPRRCDGGWNRDEWDVALASGAVCRIFQDRSTTCWFLEAIYD